jgi:hypothetical protein
MNHLAGVLSDLGLVTWPERGYRLGKLSIRKSELQRLRKEEELASDTDLSEVRKKWFEERGLDPKGAPPHNVRPIRNHGLFSKAERALQIAGWSERARNDIEIFRLVDAEGLTPVLMVLNETRGSGAERPEDQPAAAI